jgi:hypothetical protein
MTFTARRGRPPKFTRPSRTITVTLPEDVLKTLAELDTDMGRAIVRLTMAASNGPAPRGVEVATFGSRAVIVVPPTKALKQLARVELVPLADGRALISIDDEMSEEQFELTVRDLLDRKAASEADYRVLQQLLTVLQEHRHGATLTVRRIIVLRAAAGGAAHTPVRRTKGKR